MKPEDLALECIRAIQQQPTMPFIVVIGKMQVKGWPRGKCIGSDSRGEFYSYDARAVLGRLVAYGVVAVQALEKTGSVAFEVRDNPGTHVIEHEHAVEIYRVFVNAQRDMAKRG